MHFRHYNNSAAEKYFHFWQDTNAIFNQSFIEKVVQAVLAPIQCIVAEIVENAITDSIVPMVSAQVNGGKLQDVSMDVD